MSKKKHPKWLAEGWEHIWLPYTQMQTTPLPNAAVKTEGCTITLDDGRTLIDGISSWWSAAHGYNHPHIIGAMKKQLETMPHVMFAGFANEPAYKLAAKLAAMAPTSSTEGAPTLTRTFFSDSGSTAVEVAMKMALQYWQNKGQPRRDRFICIEHGYHGDTMGAMSISDPVHGMHKAFKNVLPKHYVVDMPSGEYGFAEFDETLGAIAGQIAALFIEPLVQGAGGLKFHSPDTLAEIRRLCTKHDILFIADEIATGFYRTGSRFACEEADIVPDIMTLGKGLTGGTMTLGATMVSEDIYEAFLGDDNSTAFVHGPTFMGNPLACSAALASLELFENGTYMNDVINIENQLYSELTPLRELAGVVDVRIRGAIGVVQLAQEHLDIPALRAAFAKHDVWVRPFADVIYLMPPLTIQPDELSTLTSAVCSVVEEWSKEVRAKLSHLFD